MTSESNGQHDANAMAMNDEPWSLTSMHPLRYLQLFLVVLTGLYLLVFLTGSGQAKLKLGIDLQGGTRVTLTPHTPDGATPQRHELIQAAQILTARVNGLGVAGSEVVIDGDNLVITVPGNDGSAARDIGQAARLYVRPVIGQPIPAHAASGPPPAAPHPHDDLAARIEYEKELRQSTDENVLQLAAQYMAGRCDQEDILAGNDDPNLPLVACSVDHKEVFVTDRSIISGDQLENASATLVKENLSYAVNLEFKAEAAAIWTQFTTANVGRLAAFTVDSQVVSAPQIRGPITGGWTQITSGGFTADSAKQLANILSYGSLPLSFETSEAETVSATLGLSSLRAGLAAGAIGLALVLLYSLAYYRLLGLVMALSLMASGTAIFAILVLLGRHINYSLDLAGIAGLIIGIGTTADSFVVFFERIKDQIRRGADFSVAIPVGWARARKTILSGNAVTLLAALVLYVLASGQVKGFAFTLGLTTVLDVVVVFAVTWPLMDWASKSSLLAQPALNGLGRFSTDR